VVYARGVSHANRENKIQLQEQQIKQINPLTPLMHPLTYATR